MCFLDSVSIAQRRSMLSWGGAALTKPASSLAWQGLLRHAVRLGGHLKPCASTQLGPALLQYCLDLLCPIMPVTLAAAMGCSLSQQAARLLTLPKSVQHASLPTAPFPKPGPRTAIQHLQAFTEICTCAVRS